MFFDLKVSHYRGIHFTLGLARHFSQCRKGFLKFPVHYQFNIHLAFGFQGSSNIVSVFYLIIL